MASSFPCVPRRDDIIGHGRLQIGEGVEDTSIDRRTLRRPSGGPVTDMLHVPNASRTPEALTPARFAPILLRSE